MIWFHKYFSQIEWQLPVQFMSFPTGKSFRLLASTCMRVGIKTAITMKKKKITEYYWSKEIMGTILFHENLESLFFKNKKSFHSGVHFFLIKAHPYFLAGRLAFCVWRTMSGCHLFAVCCTFCGLRDRSTNIRIWIWYGFARNSFNDANEGHISSYFLFMSNTLIDPLRLSSVWSKSKSPLLAEEG